LAVTLAAAALGVEALRAAAQASVVGSATSNLGRVPLGIADLPRAMGLAGGAGALSSLNDHVPEIQKYLAVGNALMAAKVLTDLADSYERQGNYPAARLATSRAILMQEHALGTDHPTLASSLGRLAIEMYLSGDSLGALDPALRSESISREHLRLMMQALTEDDALRAARTRESCLDLVLTLAAISPDTGLLPRVWSALLRDRGMVLDELAVRHRSVLVSRDSTLLGLGDSLGAARGRLATEILQGPAPREEGYPERLQQDRLECARLERELAGASRLVRVEFDRSRAGYEEVAGSLAPTEALVAFVRYQHLRRILVPAPPESISAQPTAPPWPHGPLPAATPRTVRAVLDTSARYLALVAIAGAAAPRILPLGEAGGIDSVAGEWRRLASQEPRDPWAGDLSDTACSSAGRRLRVRIWDPVAELLSGTTRAFVVPDGMLQVVNLAALPGRDSTFLVEESRTIQSLSAERDLAAGGPSSSPGRSLLALGDVDFDRPPNDAGAVIGAASTGARGRGDSPPDSASHGSTAHRAATSNCDDFRSVRFEPLPATAAEVRGITEAWRVAGPAQAIGEALLGTQASERALRQLAPGTQVLHLATHGFFLGDDCALKGDDSTRVYDPLVLSGLAFSGANHRAEAADPTDDGILTAEEVSSLDLSSVDLVVLSACNTALGVIRPGEGVFGLRRAFSIAGARTLIMTLWSVEDRSAESWIRAFYDARFVRGQPLGRAMRDATCQLLAGLKARGESIHPSRWAAFVATGCDR